MSDLAVIGATLAIYLVVAISPGPNFALISRLALASSRSTAAGAALGIAVSATTYAALTMAGLAMLLKEVGWLARGVQVVGGLYLIYLGLSAWRAPKPGSGAAPPPLTGRGHGIRSGLIVGFANPKSIAFFVSLYAAVVPPETALWAKVCILAGGFAIEIGWYGLIATLLSAPRSKRIYRRYVKAIERAVGALLAGFGLRMVLDGS